MILFSTYRPTISSKIPVSQAEVLHYYLHKVACVGTEGFVMDLQFDP